MRAEPAERCGLILLQELEPDRRRSLSKTTGESLSKTRSEA
jgi:hypothetical protein